MKNKEKIKEKTFDAVKFMRDQRDRISKDLSNLSAEEIIKYFDTSKAAERIKPSA
jgi:hypothetical protein